jgi:leader peptidase (prepilin peptidase)/N-methyltransferase
MIRPILPPILPVQPITAADTAVQIIGSIFLYAAVLGVFTLATWIVLQKSKDDLNDPKMIPALLTFIGVGLILLLLHGITLISVKGMILCIILMWASISDIAKHEVPDFITLSILILAFVGFEPNNLPSMLVGAVALFIPQLAVSLLCPGRSVGGSDMKISAALGFLLGAEKGLFAVIVGLAISVIFIPIVRKIKKESNKEPFALVPFLSFGAMLAVML